MPMKEFKFIDPKILRILELKNGKKIIGNICYYRETNSEVNDILDINLLNILRIKYPESTLKIIKLNTNNEKENYENIIIRKFSLKPISIHWIQEIDMPDSNYGESGKIYPTKKTRFNINVATLDEIFLKDLELEYEVLIPASDENEKLFTTFLPIL